MMLFAAMQLPESPVFTWAIVPAMIFLSRIVDVSLGTVRLICVAKGYKILAPVMGFFEVLIWILAISQIMQNLTNPVAYLAYAGGFATGNYIGLIIADRLSLGVVLVRVVTQRRADELVSRLRALRYGVTTVDGQGASGPFQVVFTILRRRDVPTVVALVQQFNPQAFYSIEEVGFVAKGVLPAQNPWSQSALLRFFRPFRKGK
jgi:uncharacterized protein YebE (UPF0316 family)